MLKISACAIVRDEEANMPDWLACMKALADEVIVVDTGSRDRTVEIAREAGARIEHFPWQDDFAAAKNYALDCCNGEWVAMLDADEYFLPEDIPKVRELVRSHHGDSSVLGFLFQRINIDKDNYGSYINSGPQIRVFRRLPELRYHGRIHENLVYEGKGNRQMVFFPGANLYHTGYSASLNRDKLLRNLALLEKDEAEGMGDGKEFYFADCHYGLGNYEEAARYAERGIESGLTVAVGDDARPYQIWIESLMLTHRPQEEILAAVQRAKKAHPESARFDFLLGFDAWERKDYLEADAAFRRGMDIVARRTQGKGEFLGGTGQEKYLADACCKLARMAKWRGRDQEAMDWLGEALASEKYNANALRMLLEFMEGLSSIDVIAALNGIYDKKGDAPFLLRNLGDAKQRQVRLYYMKQADIKPEEVEQYWLAGRTMAAAAGVAEDMDARSRLAIWAAERAGTMPENLRMLLPRLYRESVQGKTDTPRKANLHQRMKRLKETLGKR